MKVNIFTVLKIILCTIFVSWVILVSVCIVDLYVMQDYFIDAVYLLKDDIDDITINPQAMPFFVPKQNTDDILGIEQVSLSDETKELVEDLRWKHYGHGTFFCTEDSIIRWEPTVIELVDIPINLLMQLKGWEVSINDELYYVLLVGKEWIK